MKHDRDMKQPERDDFGRLFERAQRLCGESSTVRDTSQRIIFDSQDLIERVATHRKELS